MDKYWFSRKGDDLSAELSKRVQDFQKFARNVGLCHIWNKNRAFYENRVFGNNISNDILDTGEVGELKASTFNHFRNILRHTINSLVSSVPAFDVSAVNTDKKSRDSSKIGRQVVDYYYKVKRVKKDMASTAEKAVVYGDGFIVGEFNPTIGRVITTDEKKNIIREGDFDFGSFSPFDVFYDVTKRDKLDWEWVIFRRRKNKFDIAELFPNRKQDILGLETSCRDDEYSEYFLETGYDADVESDDIFVYAAYHRSNNVLPKGKYVLFAGDVENPVMLSENNNPYRDDLPVFPLSPSTFLETCFGFTEANVLRSSQMMATLAVSAIITNMNSGTVKNIWSPKGSNLALEKLAEGLNHIQSDVKPEVLDFYSDNRNDIEVLKLCIETMETLSGQNAVVRGNVRDTPNLKSGVALATVIQQSQQYSQALKMAFDELFEDVFTFILKTLKRVASEERIIEVVGKSKRSMVKSFTGKDLNGVSRVVITQTNPIIKMPAGKIEVANEMLKLGVITPVQYFDVINTGNLDVATESDEKLMNYIGAVKEALLEGKQVPPIPGINHQLFIQEIQSLLYDLDLTSNPENKPIVQNIITLINGHLSILRNGDEVSAFIFGGKPPTPRPIGNEELEQMPEMAQPPQPRQAEPAQPVGGPPTQQLTPPNPQMGGAMIPPQ